MNYPHLSGLVCCLTNGVLLLKRDGNHKFPQILKRVIERKDSHIHRCAAVSHDDSRLRLKKNKVAIGGQSRYTINGSGFQTREQIG